MASQTIKYINSHAPSAELFLPNNNQDGGTKSQEPDNADEGKEEDEIDEYDRIIVNIIGNQDSVGPDSSENVGRILEKCLGSALDEGWQKRGGICTRDRVI